VLYAFPDSETRIQKEMYLKLMVLRYKFNNIIEIIIDLRQLISTVVQVEILDVGCVIFLVEIGQRENILKAK